MQDCESLLICHLCIHRYKSIDTDECAEAERSRDGGGVMEQCLKDHEYESSAESVHPTPPYSVDVQWDGLAKFSAEELSASKFCNRNNDMGKAWPITLSVVTLGIPEFLKGEKVIFLFHDMFH